MMLPVYGGMKGADDGGERSKYSTVGWLQSMALDGWWRKVAKDEKGMSQQSLGVLE